MLSFVYNINFLERVLHATLHPLLITQSVLPTMYLRELLCDAVNSVTRWSRSYCIQTCTKIDCISTKQKQKQTPCPLRMSAGLTVESQPTTKVSQPDCGIKENKAHLLHTSAFWGAKDQRTMQTNIKCI